jgi:hypothetical protein
MTFHIHMMCQLWHGHHNHFLIMIPLKTFQPSKYKKINDILIIMWWLWNAHYYVACSNLHYIHYIFLTTMTKHIHGHTCIFTFYVFIWWRCGFSIYYFPSLFLSLLLTMSNKRVWFGNKTLIHCKLYYEVAIKVFQYNGSSQKWSWKLMFKHLKLN